MDKAPGTQEERLDYLIAWLEKENPRVKGIRGPHVEDYYEKRQLLRALLNVRAPAPIDEDFVRVQDEFLQGEQLMEIHTDLAELPQNGEGIRIWQGDITTLRVDAIVNAANSTLLGCFSPCHNCVDNIIHTKAGVQLRLACSEIMKAQGHPEPAGLCKLTPAFNLPCKYVLHTVGPIIDGEVTDEKRRLLASCYTSCLATALEHDIRSVAFCGISTGVFSFPKEEAAKTAVAAVRAFLQDHDNAPVVVFDTFTDEDLAIYHKLLFHHD